MRLRGGTSAWRLCANLLMSTHARAGGRRHSLLFCAPQIPGGESSGKRARMKYSQRLRPSAITQMTVRARNVRKKCVTCQILDGGWTRHTHTHTHTHTHKHTPRGGEERITDARERPCDMYVDLEIWVLGLVNFVFVSLPR